MNVPIVRRLRLPRRPQPTPEETAARSRERAAREERRREAAARRRHVAGQLATTALSWGLGAWIEGAMWVCLIAGLGVNYLGSYADLAATFGAFGYDGWVRWIMPLGIDLPVTASVLAQLLAGRWKCGWWVRVRLGLLTAATAPLTLAGNALRGAIDTQGHFTFHVELWMDLVAFAVPGLGVVLIGYVASMMQGERAELTRRRLEAEADQDDANEPAPGEEARSGQGDDTAEERADAERGDVRNPQPRQPARVEVRSLLRRSHGVLTDSELKRLAVRVHERTGVSIPRARRLLREEQQPRLVTDNPQRTRTQAEAER